MNNAEEFKSLILFAKERVDDIFKEVEKSKGTQNYASFYKSDNGYTAGVIHHGQYLGHGFYIDFGGCVTRFDIIFRIRQEELGMEALIDQGLCEYVGI